MKKNKNILIICISVISLLSIVTSICSAQNVIIGKQTWMKKNLDVSAFRNGDPILQAKTGEEWRNAGNSQTPAWCYYNNDPSNAEFGKLYNWFAVNDPRGLAPVG